MKLNILMKIIMNYLKRGALVIFYSKERNELIIKRLIGLPNDKIVVEYNDIKV